MATQYTESTSGLLPYWTEAQNRMLGQGEQLYNQQRWGTVPQQGVAGLTPDQQAAFELARSSAGTWQPALDQSQQFLTQAGQGAQFDPNQVQQYLNPYLSGVIGEIGRLGQQGFQETVAPAIANQFGGLGQYGSARQAMALAEAGGRQQRETLGQQATALKGAYDTAMQGYKDWTQMGIGAKQAAGIGLGNLGQQMQGLYTGDIANLSTAGATQQKQQQDILNSQFQQWQQQQQYPWQALNQWADLFKTGQPQTSTSWNTAFKKGGLARYATGGRFRNDDPFGRMIQAESGGRHRDESGELLRSPKGALGITQIMPETALNPGYGVTPLQNDSEEEYLRVGQDYLGALTNHFGGDKTAAVAAYNWGPGNVERAKAKFGKDWLIHAPKETKNYVSTVLGDQAQSSDTVPVVAETVPTVLNQQPSIQVAAGDLTGLNLDLPRRAFDERIALLERARNAPELAPLEQDDWMTRVGEAMMRAGAEGPANIGQLIGRSGTAYFDKEAAIEAENKARALKRLEIEEKIAPEVSSTGFGLGTKAGSQFDFKVTPEGLVRVNRLTGETNLELPNTESNRLKFEKIGYETAVAQGHPDPVAYSKAFAQSAIEGRQIGEPSPTGTAAQPAGTAAAAGQPPASDTLSNLPTQGQVAQQKEEGKEAASTFATINKTAAQAADQLQTLDQVEYALQNLQTGKLAPPISTMQQWVGSLSQTLGIKTDIDFEKLGSHEALNTIVGQMALGMHKVGTGQMTDADLAHFKTLTPSLAKTPEGNAKIIEAARKLANRQIELGELAKQYRETNPKGILDAGWEKYKRAWMEANPLYPEAAKEKEATSAPASETTGAAPKVRRFNPETGRIE